MTVKAIILSKRKPGLTHEQFRQQYDEHVELALKYFGHLWVSYKRHFLGPVTFLESAWPPPENPPEGPYDAVAELVYRDMAALEEQGRIIAADPELGRVTVEDEMRTFDRSVTCITFQVDTVETDLSPYRS